MRYSNAVFSYRTARVRRQERMENFLEGLAGGVLAIVLFITILSW